MRQDLDPTKPIVGEDGLEYENLGSLIFGFPADCWRNDLVKEFGPQGVDIWKLYHERSRDGARFTPTGLVLPQGLDAFDPSLRSSA